MALCGLSTSRCLIILVSVTILVVLLEHSSATRKRFHIKILSVSRRPKPNLNANRYVVRFRHRLTGILFTILDDGVGAKKRTKVVFRQRKYRAMFTVKNNITNPKFIITSSTKRHEAYIILNNTGMVRETHKAPRVPRHWMQPDLVDFVAGKPFFVMFVMRAKTRMRESFALEPEFRSWVVSPHLTLRVNTHAYNYFYGNESFVTTNSVESRKKYHAKVFKVDVKNDRLYSGYFYVHIKMNGTGGNVIDRMVISDSIKVKPVGQTDFVPKDYLQVWIAGQNCSLPIHSDLTCECRVGQPCRFNCTVYGPDTLGVWVQDEHRRNVTNVTHSPVVNTMERDVHWSVTPTKTSGGADHKGFFTCWVQNRGGNKRLFRRLDVNYIDK